MAECPTPTPDLVQAQRMYVIYLEAEEKIVSGAQSYQIGNRALTRANLSEIIAQREKWGNLIDRLSCNKNGGARVTQVVPRDS